MSNSVDNKQNNSEKLTHVGLSTSNEIFYQRPVEELIDQAVSRKEGVLAENGALSVRTGKYTGRSPNDRFIVDTPVTHDTVNWGKVNVPTTPEVFDKVYEKVKAWVTNKDLFVFDGYCGADTRHQLSVRFINTKASQNLFVHQMFIRPEESQLESFSPEFTVIAVPDLLLDPNEIGTNSEAAIIVNFDKKMVLVAASQYSGEMKKSIFSVMNYLMPDRNVFPMHCSCNVGDDGKSALFFGLSGTGKTTLSADPERSLIGDDEHGWSPDGIFNFEGGCYAKAIRLSKENEPEIWDAIRYGALAENIVMKDGTTTFDYDDESITENTRVAYPVDFIPNVDLDGMTGHPNAVIFLTADAFGVLPAVSKLTEEQAQYHFISGYTSKLAGTERGITEPEAVFSTCFGEPFMPRPSAVYAELLKKRIQEHKVSVYLVNTGWQGGSYGVGKRISIPHTRAIISAILNGELNEQEFTTHPVFNVQVPQACPSVPESILDPRASWTDKEAYDTQAEKLAGMFVKNFKTFKGVEHLVEHGPVSASVVKV